MKHLYLLAALSVTAPAIAAPLEGSRPNIVLVMTDDQGMGDLSCMGNEVVRTPKIDHFYEKATRFTDFQVSPTCAPTPSAGPNTGSGRTFNLPHLKTA